MNNQHDQAHIEKFQRERIALFSDAVFAIAITLLVLEIKIPELHGNEITDHNLINGLLSIIPRFIGFIVSFFVIGLYWMAHHRLFKFVVHINQKLLTTNLLFLLPIVIMPFSTVFLSEYYSPELHTPLVVYTINICFTGIGSYRLWKVVASPKYKLSQGMDELILEYNITRALTIPIVFFLMLMLSFILPWVVYVAMPLVPVITIFIKRFYKKKYPQLWKLHYS